MGALAVLVVAGGITAPCITMRTGNGSKIRCHICKLKRASEVRISSAGLVA